MAHCVVRQLDQRIASDLTVQGANKGFRDGKAYVVLYKEAKLVMGRQGSPERDVLPVARLVQEVGGQVFSALIEGSKNWGEEPRIRLSPDQYEDLKKCLEPSETCSLEKDFKAEARVKLTQTEWKELVEIAEIFKICHEKESDHFYIDLKSFLSGYPHTPRRESIEKQKKIKELKEKIIKHNITSETVYLTPSRVGIIMAKIRGDVDKSDLEKRLLSYFPPPSKEISVTNTKTHKNASFSPDNYARFIERQFHFTEEYSRPYPGGCTEIKEVQIQITRDTEEKKE